MDRLTEILTIFEIIVAGFAILGTIYSTYRWIMVPIKNKVSTFCDKIDNIFSTVDKLSKIEDEKVLPFIDSFQKEFSRNSGKSIKDQITRIDNNTRLSELRSKLVLNNLLTTGVYECDANGECIWVNKTLCEMYGMSFEEMLGKGWLSAVADDERTEVWENWLDDINYGIPHEGEYNIVNKKTGLKFKCRVSVVAHKTVDGKILGYHGTVIKI